MTKPENSKCYTYSVNLILQVIAKDEISARQYLDNNGGYVTLRDVKLLNSVDLFNKYESQ